MRGEIHETGVRAAPGSGKVRKGVANRLLRNFSLLALAAAGAGASQLVLLLREPPRWMLVPAAWMGTPGVQRLLYSAFESAPFLWVVAWAALGMEIDAFILRLARRKEFLLERVSFVALWLLACSFGSEGLTRLFDHQWLGAFWGEHPYSIAPLAVLPALVGHIALVILLRGRRRPYSFAVVVPGVAAGLAALHANIYWLPEVVPVVSLGWTTAIFLVGAALCGALWRLDAFRLERFLQWLSDALLSRPAVSALLLAAVLSVTFVLGLAVQRGKGGEGQGSPNIILITADTLRADHLGSYGYMLDTTPNLDRFAMEGTVFTRCFSTAPITNPSVASILTSQYPSLNSVGIAGGNTQTMLPDQQTLARTLEEDGYYTAAFVSNYVLRRDLRFYPGFDIYDDTFTSAEPTRGLMERAAEKTSEYAINWLSNGAKERFFLWVHYQDPHGPYTPPSRYLRRFPKDAYPSGLAELTVTDNRGKGGIPEYQYLDGQTSPSFYRSRYDAEIAYMDEFIGRLIESIKDLGFWERSIVIFTADHGESMDEHGYYFCHQQDLTNELIHVPLIIYLPGLKQVGRVDELVSTVDIGPTILESAGLSERLGDSGLSLRNLVRGDIDRLDREYVVAEDTHGRLCLLSREAKYIHGPDGERLYDMDADPGEMKNLLAAEPDMVAPWRAIRDSYREKAKPHMGNALRHDPDDAERLKSLGYIN